MSVDATTSAAAGDSVATAATLELDLMEGQVAEYEDTAALFSYPVTIMSVHGDGSYTIRHPDGNTLHTDRSCLRLLAVEGTSADHTDQPGPKRQKVADDRKQTKKRPPERYRRWSYADDDDEIDGRSLPRS